MNAMMGGTYLRTPQSIFQHMMGQQNAGQQDGRQWMQVPQVPPISMPWSMPSSQQPNIIRFTGERPQPNYATTLHQKRKLKSTDVVDMRQKKQFITEEKMAAHFQELHISSNCISNEDPTPSTSTSFTAAEECNKVESQIDLDMEGVNMVESERKTPRLIMSEELKRLQHDSILPSSLLSKLERPSMALVLWEPPNKHLRLLPTPRDTPTPIPSTTEDNNNNTTASNNSNLINNNNESIPNLNSMSSNEVMEPSLEPMDL